MKNKIKIWLGIVDYSADITDLKARLGKEKKVKSEWPFYTITSDFWFGKPRDNSLFAKHQQLRDDFEELDKKFDALERYLQVEYYKEDKETQVYDWADKKHSEGFRKTDKTYEQMKKSKEVKEDED